MPLLARLASYRSAAWRRKLGDGRTGHGSSPRAVHDPLRHKRASLSWSGCSRPGS